MADLDKERNEQRLTAADIPPSYLLTPAEQQFIDGLNKLTARTGIKIKGCGCCGSPWLMGGAHTGHYELSDHASCLRWVPDHG